jgi:hypothetical protein
MKANNPGWMPSLVIILLMPALATVCLLSCTAEARTPESDSGSIDISSNHPSYWSYKGNDILLLGGSVQDNLFQIPDLAEHLDLLVSVGGNYVRNTMSSRDSGNVWAFYRQENGLYDLNRWNDEYWRRFETFLVETEKRDIIVQIEIWATFDYYRDNWDINPFNPKNNINYEPRRSKLTEVVETHPIFTENNFFRSVPSQMALAQVLWYQQQFVDRILSFTLRHGHILYCMDNETSVTADWGSYWARYIQKQAALAGRKVHTTQMWDPWELSHPFHAETFDNPDLYTFVDISQNNHQSADAHWNNGLQQFGRLQNMGFLRPVNNVKIYGNDGGAHKTTRDAIENFVKNVFMGCASARFHRPTSGQGLNEVAQGVIRSTRGLSDRMDFFNGSPRNDLLISREPGGAYCRAIAGREYAVYFPRKGSVELDVSELRSPRIEWLNLLSSGWFPAQAIERGKVQIQPPGDGHWIALVTGR